MSAGLHLAGPEQAALCLGLAAQYHAEMGAPYDDTHRQAIIEPLVQGSPLGAIWLIGPVRAPMGYVMVTFEWSVEAGGMTAWVREIYLRDKVRGRGIGTESLNAVAVALRGAGVKALHVDLHAPENPQMRFWNRAGYKAPMDRHFLTDVL